jgi:hypothetical protein
VNVSTTIENLNRFVEYAHTLRGDEKGEAQVFCDRLFQAFGHAGYKEAGATLEFRIKKKSGKGTQFADLIWKPRMLLEMKKAGEKLHLHYRQAFEYWINAVGAADAATCVARHWICPPPRGRGGPSMLGLITMALENRTGTPMTPLVASQPSGKLPILLFAALLALLALFSHPSLAAEEPADPTPPGAPRSRC